MTALTDPAQALALMRRGLQAPVTHDVVQALHMERRYPQASPTTYDGRQYLTVETVEAHGRRYARPLCAYLA